MKVSHPHWIQVLMEQELSKSPIEDSTKRHDSGVVDQGDINSHDGDMIAYESNNTSITIH